MNRDSENVDDIEKIHIMADLNDLVFQVFEPIIVDFY